jgi:hypothetical protein
LLLLIGSLESAASAQQSSPPKIADALKSAETGAQPTCSNDDPETVVVCGRSQKQFRIDPDVLAATRAANALPPKPPLNAMTAEQCVGPNCGGGSYVPLVGMALTALKAAELAANGDDWRDAFRTHPDQYQLYQQEREKKGRVRFGVTVGNRRE